MKDKKQIEAGILNAVWRLFTIALGLAILAGLGLAASGYWG